ncbi:transposase [Kutzneria buriramensis]|uniref:Transposase n=1 Tax=Kutzneria buriramensis TaxID=1045776 RepID=A0A3E0G6N2_9PSEU|nr:transposase [Kutzneria buriramensis]REH17870.1 transposase [Kutzneria buriramensis]
MALNFIPGGPGAAFVLPRDIRDWLPRRHLCWKVLEVVEELDLSGVLAGYRVDGRGRPAYHPSAMLALVLYCYSKGIRSSRRIEAACVDDVGCRVIMANREVDHATVARFLRRHRLAVKDLFVQVLTLCAQQDLVDLAAVAVDGSPMHASAGRDANQCLDRLEAAIARAEQDIDRLMTEIAEDALRAEGTGAGEALERADRRGRSAPARLSRLADRLLRARAAGDRLYQRALPPPSDLRAKIEAAERMVARAERRLAAVTAAHQARLDDHARRTRQDRATGWRAANGRPPVPLDAKTVIVRQRARLARARAGLERARCPLPTPLPTAQASLTDPDSRLMLNKRGGYCQGYNLQIASVRNQLLLAIDVHDNPADMTALVPMVGKAQRNSQAAGIADEAEAWLADSGYTSTENFQALDGLPLLVSVANERTQTGRATPRVDKPVPAGWREMAARLATPAGRDLYKRRGALVEPGSAQMFQRFGRRLDHRGIDAVDTEVKLLGTVHNLGKLFACHNTNAVLTA